MEIYIDELSNEYPHELDQQYSFQETIASGAFGTVFRAIEISTNREIAVKVINKSGAKIALLRKLKQEVSILKQLKHQNIVEFFGYTETNTKLFIMMELIKCGTLKNWIQTHKGPITEEEASTIINHLLAAVCYLHSRDICHRDIKPENIMLNNLNDLSSLKLIDFGLSQQNFDNLEDSDYCGTMLYMAPEQIEKKTYSKTVDIWSIGVIMFMLLNKGIHPFYSNGDRRMSYAKKIKKTKLKLFNKCSNMARVLLFKLLEPNPSWRYTAEKAYRHPWITRRIEDEVPETFNETLKKLNLTKKFKELMTISIFLNKTTQTTKDMKLFVINRKYVNKVNEYSIMQRDKMKRLKEKSFDVVSCESSYDSIELRDNTCEIAGNCNTIDPNKARTKASSNNYVKISLNKNVVLKNSRGVLNQKAKMKNSNVELPVLPKVQIRGPSNDDNIKNTKVLKINSNQSKRTINQSSSQNIKDSYLFSHPLITKVITVPKIKLISKQVSNENEIPKLPSSSILNLKNEPKKKNPFSLPTRNVERLLEPREKTLNNLVLGAASPKKVCLNYVIPKHKSNMLSDINICKTEGNIRILPLILPNININLNQRSYIGNI